MGEDLVADEPGLPRATAGAVASEKRPWHTCSGSRPKRGGGVKRARLYRNRLSRPGCGVARQPRGWH